MTIPQESKGELPYNPAIPLLGTDPREMTSVSQRHTAPRPHTHCNFAHSNQDMETKTKCPSMDK